MKTIREYDENQKLVGAGYQWGEPSDLRLILLLALAAVTFGLTLFGIDAIKKSGSYVLACYAIASALPATIVYQWRLRTRSLIFRSDGTIDAPHRLPDFLWPRYKVGGNHKNIVSIGQLVDQDLKGKTQHRTALYAKNGNVVRVTGDVYPDVAHKVAVQLTAALQEIRDAMAGS